MKPLDDCSNSTACMRMVLAEAGMVKSAIWPKPQMSVPGVSDLADGIV